MRPAPRSKGRLAGRLHFPHEGLPSPISAAMFRTAFSLVAWRSAEMTPLINLAYLSPRISIRTENGNEPCPSNDVRQHLERSQGV